MFDYDKLIKKCFEKNLQKIKGVIHIGACWPCNQTPIYVKNNINNICLIEASEFLYKNLLKDQKRKIASGDKIIPLVFNEVISSDNQKKLFYQYFNDASDNKGCSSLYQADPRFENLELEKELLVETITIDSFFKKHSLDMKTYNFLVMDIQGSELDALHGAKEFLKNVDFICCEVSYERTYKNSCTHSEIDNFLFKNGFIKKDYLPVTKIWGDAYYVRG